MKRSLGIATFVTLFFIMSAVGAWATAYTWNVVGGDGTTWASGLNWGGGAGYPGSASGDTASFVGATVTIGAFAPTFTDFTVSVDSASSVTVTPAFTAASVAVNGNFTANGAVTLTSLTATAWEISRSTVEGRSVER